MTTPVIKDKTLVLLSSFNARRKVLFNQEVPFSANSTWDFDVAATLGADAAKYDLSKTIVEAFLHNPNSTDIMFNFACRMDGKYKVGLNPTTGAVRVQALEAGNFLIRVTAVAKPITIQSPGGGGTVFFLDNFDGAGALDNHVSDSGQAWARGPESSNGDSGVVLSGGNARAGVTGAFCEAVSDPVILTSTAAVEVQIRKIKEPSVGGIFAEFGLYYNDVGNSVQAGFTLGSLIDVGQTHLGLSDYTSAYYHAFGAKKPIAMAVGDSVIVRLEVSATQSVLSVNGVPVFTNAEVFDATGLRPYVAYNTSNGEPDPCFEIDYIKVTSLQ